MNPDDTSLKKGLRNGDREVYKYLYLNYSPGLIAYGSSVTSDTDAAREIVQDLFLELWEKRNSIHIHGPVKPYLYSSVYHRALNWLRARKIREIYQNHPLEISKWFSGASPSGNPDPLQTEIIEKEIRMLPPQCREVFTHSVVMGESHAEIAVLLGLNIKTVENHLARARKILRGRLKNIR